MKILIHSSEEEVILMKRQTTSRQRPFMLMIVAVSSSLIIVSHQNASSQKPGGLVLPYHGVTTDQTAAFEITNEDDNKSSVGVFGHGGIGVGGFGGQGKSAAGVDGRADNGFGVYGLSKNSVGVVGILGSSFKDFKTRGILGAEKTGVEGESKMPNGFGVLGRSQNSIGVVGLRGTSFDSFETRGILGTEQNGVEGVSRMAGGKGIAGRADNGTNAVAVYGESSAGLAGFFRGRVTITQSLLINEIFTKQITGAVKLFRIDHPLYPAEKYLSHNSLESDEMANFYSGNVTLDHSGRALVTLPSWFQTLNKDFRYQLTCVGGYSPVYIAREIQENRFEIAGGKAGMKVSWQVTGIRQDPYALTHPLQVEQDKAPAERGYYLNPVELGYPESRGINMQASRLERNTESVLPKAKNR